MMSSTWNERLEETILKARIELSTIQGRTKSLKQSFVNLYNHIENMVISVNQHTHNSLISLELIKFTDETYHLKFSKLNKNGDYTIIIIIYFYLLDEGIYLGLNKESKKILNILDNPLQIEDFILTNTALAIKNSR